MHAFIKNEEIKTVLTEDQKNVSSKKNEICYCLCHEKKQVY